MSWNLLKVQEKSPKALKKATGAEAQTDRHIISQGWEAAGSQVVQHPVHQVDQPAQAWGLCSSAAGNTAKWKHQSRWQSNELNYFNTPVELVLGWCQCCKTNQTFLQQISLSWSNLLHAAPVEASKRHGCSPMFHSSFWSTWNCCRTRRCAVVMMTSQVSLRFSWDIPYVAWLILEGAFSQREGKEGA